MRIDIADLLRPHARAAAQEDELTLPAAPLSGSRGQRLQRLQVGLFGLVAMVLLVGLASIIQTNAERTEAQVVAEAAPAAPASAAPEVNDPLADAGVIPSGPDAAQGEPQAPVQAPAQGNGQTQPARP